MREGRISNVIEVEIFKNATINILYRFESLCRPSFLQIAPAGRMRQFSNVGEEQLKKGGSFYFSFNARGAEALP